MKNTPSWVWNSVTSVVLWPAKKETHCRSDRNISWSEVVTGVMLKNQVLCDVKLCCWVNCSRGVAESQYLFLQAHAIEDENKVFVLRFVCVCVCFWRDSPQWARASSFTRFLDHTQRRTTVGRNPLDEWSARRRDLYLTTHNTHNRQISMPPVGFEPTISAVERPQTYALDRAATGICCFEIWCSQNSIKIMLVLYLTPCDLVSSILN